MAFDSRLFGGIGVMAAVVETGSFARAGAALGLTQSGVSRAIARLEERVGVRLFDRNPRAVTLTDEGRRFHAQVAPLLVNLEEAATDAAQASASVRGRLRVNVDPWFARLLLAPRLPGLCATHPELSLDIVVRDTLGDFINDGMDVAVRFGDPEPSALVARKLFETHVVTCAAPSYLAQHGTPREPRDIEKHECLLFRNPATGRPFAWEFRRGSKAIDVKVSGQLTFNDLATKLAACVAGQGIAQSFALGLDPFLESGALVQILPEWADERFPLHIYHPSHHLPPAKVRAFMTFIEEAVLAMPQRQSDKPAMTAARIPNRSRPR
jgi:DNA-binding transcriptional LysR family regulator